MKDELDWFEVKKILLLPFWRVKLLSPGSAAPPDEQRTPKLKFRVFLIYPFWAFETTDILMFVG